MPSPLDTPQVRTRVVTAVLTAIVVAVPLFPEWFGLGSVTPFVQLVAFRPQGIVVLAVLGALVTIRKRVPGIVILALALTAAVLTAPRVLSRPDSAQKTITVMASNVLGGGADPDSVARIIRERRPAFVSLPEARTDVRDAILQRVSDLGYRGYTEQPESSPVGATSVLVAPELGDVTVQRHQPDTRFGTVIVKAGDLTLVGYHSYPPLPGRTGTWRHDLEALRTWCEGRTIVAGDFNATPDHVALRNAIEGCTDVGPATGNGLDGTWPAHRPGVLRAQIDHVVVTEDLAAVGFSTYDIEGSDHRAVVATVGLP